MAIQIKRLTKPKISPNGTEVKFTAHVSKGAALDVIFPVSEIDIVVEALQRIATTTMLDRGTAALGDSIKGKSNTWQDAPSVVLVTEFQVIEDSHTGGFHLRVKNLTNDAVDVSFDREQATAFRKAIVEYQPTPRSSGIH